MVDYDIQDEMESLRKQKKKAPKQPEQKTLTEHEASAEAGDIDAEVEDIRSLRDKPAKMRKAAVPEQPAEEPAAEPAAEEPRIYVVKSGDSLSKIAEKVYGNAGRWREIYKANKDQIENPSLIRPGWKLRIP